MQTKRLLSVMCLAALLGVLIAPAASATTYTVDSATFTMTNDVSIADLWDTYELTASSGQTIEYSISSTAGCVMLLFVSGHTVTWQSQYYISYSETNCVTSYSNKFPVSSTSGTDFSVLVATTSMTPVTYTVTVNTVNPGLSSAVIGLIVLVVIAAVVVVAVLLLRRRKKAAPMAPPAYMGPYAAPPTQPPAYPPQQPPQGPPLTPP